jgi:hypothetical protein
MLYDNLKFVLPEFGIPTEVKKSVQKVVSNAFISQVNRQTMHTKSIIHNNIAMIFRKTIYPVRDSNPGLLFPRRMRCPLFTPPGHEKELLTMYTHTYVQLHVKWGLHKKGF